MLSWWSVGGRLVFLPKASIQAVITIQFVTKEGPQGHKPVGYFSGRTASLLCGQLQIMLPG